MKKITSIMAILTLIMAVAAIIISVYTISISKTGTMIVVNRNVSAIENREDTKMQVDPKWDGNITRIREGKVYRYGENCVLLDNTDTLYTISIQENGKIKKEKYLASSVEDVSVTEDAIYFLKDGTLYYKSNKTQ